MKTTVIDNQSGFEALESKWGSLLENFSYRDIGHSFRWYSNWSRSFIAPAKMRIVAIEKDDQLVSLMPLYEDKVSFLKLKLPVLKSMTNWHSNRFDMLAQDDNSELLSKTMNMAFSSSNRHVILLNYVPADSYVMKWIEKACTICNYKYVTSEHSTNFLVKKGSSFSDFFGKLDGKFRRNVGAAEKKALSRGGLTLQQLSNEEDLESFLQRGFSIEASGWKGKQKTAVINSHQTKNFYEGIAKDLQKEGKFKAFLLKSGKDDLAFLYCVEAYGAIRALKIGANEEFRSLAPGMLITRAVLEHLHDRNDFSVWDFCGGEARWKRDWGNSSEKLFSIAIYNDSLLGKVLYRFNHFTKRPFI